VARPPARELEARAAGLAAPPRRGGAPEGEALAMLRRRGLTPRIAAPRLPLPPGLDAGPLRERLAHYGFRLFLRGALLAEGDFAPREATRYLDAARAREHAEWLVAHGLAARAGGGRYRLAAAGAYGDVLEWWVGGELARRLALDVATGVRSGERGVGGDLDVVAAAEGKLLYVELKSSPPKHLSGAEVAAFLRRVRALRPDVAVFAIDTALRLGDKVVPMFAAALGPAAPPRRLGRESWQAGPHLYLVNARQDLLRNLERAIAAGLRALAPPPP
jgi:hypothetical protein